MELYSGHHEFFETKKKNVFLCASANVLKKIRTEKEIFHNNHFVLNYYEDIDNCYYSDDSSEDYNEIYDYYY